MAGRVVMLAVDGLDWVLLRSLVAAGRLGPLASMLRAGAWGDLDVGSAVWGLDAKGAEALVSPLLWTTAASGTYYFSHGIFDFRDFMRSPQRPPLFSGSDVRQARIWDILSSRGQESLVVGYMVTHPAVPIRGVIVSDLFGETSDPAVVHPRELADPLARAAGAPDYAALVRGGLAAMPMDEMELSSPAPPVGSDEDRQRVESVLHEFLGDRPDLVQRYLHPDASPEDARYRSLLFHRLVYPCLRDARFHRVFLELLRMRPQFAFAVCYYRLVDSVSHGFWTEGAAVSDEFRRNYGQVLPRACDRIAAQVAEVQALLTPEDVLIVLSDHGFTAAPPPDGAALADDLEYRPVGEHRAPGVFMARGESVRPGRVENISILDVCPTICDYLGLPQAEAFDGGVVPGLLHAEAPRKLPLVDSYARVSGSADEALSQDEQRRLIKHLAALGYLEE